MMNRLAPAAYFLLPPVALLLHTRLPGWVVLLVLLPPVLLLFVLQRRRRRAVIALLDAGDQPDPEQLATDHPHDPLERAALRLRRRHDETVLRLVHTNIQLLSVRELWQALAQPGRLEHTVDRALSYCHRASGFQEVMILRLETPRRELIGRWLHPGREGPVMESVRWSIGGISGAVARALRQPRSILAERDASEPLLKVNGEAPANFSRPRSYLVVPLLTPLPRRECIQEGWLYHDDCPSFEPARPEDRRENCIPQAEGGLDLGPCLCCRHYPLYGLMIVTDEGRPEGIHKGDQLTLESLSYAVSAVLQNASLYTEVQREERFRKQILDGMTNGLFTADHRGRIIFTNRRAQHLLGRSAQELVGSRLDKHLSVTGVRSLVTSVVERRQPLLRNEGILRDAEDRPIPVLVNAAPYQREDGGARGVIVVVEDLSAVHAMQEEIRHLDTLAAIGRFASSMAHEIRNPLGGISAGMDYLQRHVSIEGDQAESLAMIRSEIARLDGIIRRLFEVTRPVKLEPIESDPVQTARRALRALEEWARQRGVRLELEREGEGELPACHLDRDQIHQVLLNLIKNAVEASGEGATVTVKLHVEEDSAEGDRVVFEIIDRGAGIEADDLGRIFEPFFTRKAKGTGLGLFVSHNIVQRHGGNLQVESQPGRHTVFRMSLPLVPALIGSRS